MEKGIAFGSGGTSPSRFARSTWSGSADKTGAAIRRSGNNNNNNNNNNNSNNNNNKKNKNKNKNNNKANMIQDNP